MAQILQIGVYCLATVFKGQICCRVWFRASLEKRSSTLHWLHPRMSHKKNRTKLHIMHGSTIKSMDRGLYFIKV